MEEGIIKFKCELIESSERGNAVDVFENPKQFEEINKWRNLLFEKKLIGSYNNGIGYGNVSICCKKNPKQFIITGSGTGKINELQKNNYSKVLEYDFEKNWLKCSGCKASSESLTHAAVYESNPEINAVIHVHNLQLWKKLLEKKGILKTNADVRYGTPEMAKEIIGLLKGNEQEKGIIVMAGHEEGILSFGKNIEEAGKNLLSLI